MRSRLFHVLLTCTLLASARVASAQEFKAGDIVVLHPWSRATPTGAKVGAGYFVIENRGKTPDRLLGGSVEAAARFEIHDTVVEDGVMRMRELKSLELPPGGSIEAKPGGRHVMFGGLLHPLAAGGKSKASCNSSTPAGSRSSLTLSGWGPRHRAVAAIERVSNLFALDYSDVPDCKGFAFDPKFDLVASPHTIAQRTRIDAEHHFHRRHEARDFLMIDCQRAGRRMNVRHDADASIEIVSRAFPSLDRQEFAASRLSCRTRSRRQGRRAWSTDHG